MNDVLMHDAPAGRTVPTPMAGNFNRPDARTLAKRDLIDGASRWWLWLSMAWQDIRHRYRGSVLGPFWLTISMSVMIATLGFLYSTLFQIEVQDYLPFLALGLLIWSYISTIMIEGCNTFVSAEPIIRQIRMPFTVHVCRTICRNVIVMAHNAVVLVIVVLIFDLELSLYSLLAILGFAILVLNSFWVVVLLGMICTRFRDVSQIVASIVQVLFFVSPIIWKPEALQERFWIAEYNPIYAMIEIVRAPLLNESIHATSLFLVAATTVIGSIGTFLFFTKFRHRIPYWI